MYRCMLNVCCGNVKKLFLFIYVLPASFDSLCYWCCWLNIICASEMVGKIRDKIHFSTNYDIFVLFSHLKKEFFPLLCDKINQFPPKSHKLPSSIFLVHKLLFPWTFFCFLIIFCHMSVCMCVYICVWILPLKNTSVIETSCSSFSSILKFLSNSYSVSMFFFVLIYFNSYRLLYNIFIFWCLRRHTQSDDINFHLN